MLNKRLGFETCLYSIPKVSHPRNIIYWFSWQLHICSICSQSMLWIILYLWPWILSGGSLCVGSLIIWGSIPGTSNLRLGWNLHLFQRMFCRLSSLQKSTRGDSESSCLRIFCVSQIIGAQKYPLMTLVNFVVSGMIMIFLNQSPKRKRGLMVFLHESLYLLILVF